MTRPARTSLLVPALALLALFGTRASASLPAAQYHHDAATAVLDPDPADCPFCGGNAGLHVKRMVDLERVTLGMYTSLLR
jgi:hypothetical protein